MPFSLVASHSEQAEGTLPRCPEEEAGTRRCQGSKIPGVCVSIPPGHRHLPTVPSTPNMDAWDPLWSGLRGMMLACQLE